MTILRRSGWLQIPACHDGQAIRQRSAFAAVPLQPARPTDLHFWNLGWDGRGAAQKRVVDGWFVRRCGCLGRDWLAQQIRQLWRHFHGEESLTEHQRWGFRFAAFWRVCVVLLLIGGFIWGQMERVGFLSLVERPNDFNSTGRLLRSANFFLLLLFMAGNAAPPRLALAAPRRWIEPAALAVGSVLALLLWWDQLMIWFLFHVACEGIAATTPVRFLESRAVSSLAARYGPFVWGSVAAVFLSALILAVAWRLSKPSRSGLRLSIALLVILLAACYALDFWLATTALRRASPFLQGAQEPRPAHVWITAFLVVGISVTFWSYQWCAGAWDTANQSNEAWRSSRRCLHEGASCAVLLAVAAAGIIAHGLIEVSQWTFGVWSLPTMLFGFMMQPQSLLALATLLVASGRIFGGLRRRTVSPARGIAALSPTKFALVWTALMIASPAAVIAIAALSFALWLTPWYKLPLPELW